MPANLQSSNSTMQIDVVHQLTSTQKNDLLVLYKNEWWTCDRTLADIETILSKSSLIIGLVDAVNNRLIGFTRVLSDYFKYTYIYDVIIHPDYRGMDLGKKLINTVLQHSDFKNLRLELTCRKDMMSFYKQFEFSEDYGASIAMFKAN